MEVGSDDNMDNGEEEDIDDDVLACGAADVAMDAGGDCTCRVLPVEEEAASRRLHPVVVVACETRNILLAEGTDRQQEAVEVVAVVADSKEVDGDVAVQPSPWLGCTDQPTLPIGHFAELAVGLASYPSVASSALVGRPLQ